MIKAGKPRQLGRGTCPDMDEAGHPEGVNIRVGAGLKPFAYEQDCAVYEENKDRIQVIDHMTEAGVAVPVIRIIGDGGGRTGGAYMLGELDNPTTWESGVGVRQVVVFSPQSPLDKELNANVELRGLIPVILKNEGSSCVLVTIKDDCIKVLWFRDPKEGDGGGSRLMWEFPFKFRRYNWYSLDIGLLPDLTELNTWDVNIRLQDLKRPGNYVSFVPVGNERPNGFTEVTAAGGGDEMQGETEAGRRGGTWLYSRFEDERLLAA